ncbi:MAG TPA: N-acetyltransferase [Candidatus Binatia bacterium]|nr:N-acetyltransferase [Candidatus Binatia bacterium]
MASGVTSQPAAVAFTIRDYRPEDFDRLWAIDQRCFLPGIAYTPMELSGFVRKRHAITLVGEFQSPGCNDARTGQADRIAGFVVAHPVRRQYGRILTLDILPGARRSGLATALMSACEQRLRAVGCKEVYLETAVDNEAALRLYKKLGYQVLGTLPEYYSSHSLDAFQMGKRL